MKKNFDYKSNYLEKTTEELENSKKFGYKIWTQEEFDNYVKIITSGVDIFDEDIKIDKTKMSPYNRFEFVRKIAYYFQVPINVPLEEV